MWRSGTHSPCKRTIRVRFPVDPNFHSLLGDHLFTIYSNNECLKITHLYQLQIGFHDKLACFLDHDETSKFSCCNERVRVITELVSACVPSKDL